MYGKKHTLKKDKKIDKTQPHHSGVGESKRLCTRERDRKRENETEILPWSRNRKASED